LNHLRSRRRAETV